MTLSIRHLFQSSKSDGPDTALVQPSNWNDLHEILLAGSRILGRWHATAGAAEEISVGSGLHLDSASGVLSADPTTYPTGKLLGRASAGTGLPEAITVGGNLNLDATTSTLSAPDQLPVGTVVDYAGLTAPAKWKFCAGQAISRTTYADLFVALGTTYGTGDGTTTFNLPDLRGRVTAGKDNMAGGGGSANRLTGKTGGVDGDVLGASGGEETHGLTITELPPHGHPFRLARGGSGGNSDGGTDGGLMVNSETGQSPKFIDYPANSGAISSTAGKQIGGTGGTGSPVAVVEHNNVQPTFILNKIIYAGAV